MIVKTHELWSGETGLYVVRDPRDVYCSYSRYMSHLKGRFVSTEELIDESWSKHVVSWRKPDVHVVRYEDLLSDPIVAMRDVLGRLAIDTSEVGDLPDLGNLHAGCGWYYQVGKAGRYRNELTQSAINLCESVNGPVMRELGYF